MNAYIVNGQNVKQVIAIQVTFISENKLQKDQVLAKYDWVFFSSTRASSYAAN